MRKVKCQTGEVFTDYKKYLKSRHWKNIKRKYYSTHDYVCAKCGWNRNLDLHHLHYRNIGKERMEDLTPLCRRCHLMEHGLLREKKKGRVEFKILIVAVVAWVLVRMWFYEK